MSNKQPQTVDEAFELDQDAVEEEVLRQWMAFLKGEGGTVQNRASVDLPDPDEVLSMRPNHPMYQTQKPPKIQLGLPGIREDKNLRLVRVRRRGRGNWGHAGIPGHRGGSLDRESQAERERLQAARRDRVDTANRYERRARARVEPPRDALGTNGERIHYWSVDGVVYQAENRNPEHMFKEFTGRAGLPKDLTVTQFGRQSWEFNDEKSGFHTELDRIKPYVDEAEGLKIAFEGSVLDKNGTKVGWWERHLNVETGIVHNSHFEFDTYHRGLTGSGFGGRYYAHAEKQLMDFHVQKITVYANISIGAYAWARMGFDFKPGADEAETFTESVRELWDERYGGGFPYSPGILHPWEIATLKGPDDYPLGKNFLLHGDYNGNAVDWPGVKELHPDSYGFQVGELYYREKGYK